MSAAWKKADRTLSIELRVPRERVAAEVAYWTRPPLTMSSRQSPIRRTLNRSRAHAESASDSPESPPATCI